MKNKYLFFILINFIWAFLALIYDIPAILDIPFYFWPFIIICPIFPALLAIVWWQKYNNKVNDYLFTFAATPSTIYFIGALIFYPTKMFFTGFNWLDLGQIFWVAVYGLQGFYLLSKYPTKKSAQILATSFLLLSFIIQYQTKTFRYLDFDNVPLLILLFEYVVLGITLLCLNSRPLFLLKK